MVSLVKPAVLRGAFIGGVLVAVLLVAVGISWRTVGLRMFLPIPSPGDLYPDAPPMPAVVSESTDQLLAKYEQMLADRAPNILAVLQPGLTDAEIDALESEYGITLTPDLRLLYRWRNGTPREAAMDVFPNHEFIPLDQALANRDEIRRQVDEATPIERWASNVFAGHRYAWVDIIVDLAGDGYFFDPGRTEAEGSFFFCFAEDGYYVFFPASRNYLAAVLEGIESGVFTFGDRGADTTDFEQAQILWRKYGAENIR